MFGNCSFYLPAKRSRKSQRKCQEKVHVYERLAAPWKRLKYVSSRALRIYFPVKPFNPALIRITVCNQTGCECMVCTSNPSLMTGLSCPDIGTYTRTFLDLFFEIFGCARQYEQALFLDIFGCALHSPNKFDSALACTKIALACTKIRLRSA